MARYDDDVAYDESLADRIRAALSSRNDVVEKKMFGGLAFMVAGNMACGVLGRDLMARVGEANLDAALKRPHTRVMDFTGRPSRSMVYVGPGGTKTLAAVKKWVDEVAGVAETRKKKPARRR
ncbi:MAG: TfoX/Sxy family protein [Labilithrix sp.]